MTADKKAGIVGEPPSAQEHSAGKVYLNVPYVEKDKVKRLGAKWDESRRRWFIPQIMDRRPFNRWLPDELKRDMKQEDSVHKDPSAPHYFEEKACQVDPSTVTAFGIELLSRYGKADEIVGMINFAKLAAMRNVASSVKEVYYDSQSQCCFFTLDPSVDEFGEIAATLHWAAKKNIRQFEWFGLIDHGADWAEHESGED